MVKFVIRKDVYEELIQKGFGGKKDLSKLTKKQITDKNGHTRNVWVRMGEEPKEERKGKQEVQKVKAKNSGSTDVTSNYSVGQEVSFEYGGNTLKGTITARGQAGVTIRDEKNNQYKVEYNKINSVTKNTDGTIPPEHFNASDYKKAFTDPECTNDAKGIQHVYELLGEEGKETRAKVEYYLNKQVKKLVKGDTQTRYQVNGEYTEKRLKLHQEIIDKVLSPEKIKNATPKKGEKPKYIIFGGRGGSGKSWFTDKKRAAEQGREVMFDSDKYITLDADAIKSELPEYEGWNAQEVHEESSDLMKKIKKIALEKGLNIIVDGTMGYNPDKPDKVKNEVLDAKNRGYSTEAHYMFTPLQKSCINAMNRFRTKKGDYSGRLVPTNILLSMQDNEKSFDSVKDIVDDWSFRDNQNFEAKVISQKSK